jgi:hypothetical protein
MFVGGFAVTSDTVLASIPPPPPPTCSSLLAPHNASGTTPFSMAFTATNGSFTGWMSTTVNEPGNEPSLSSDGTYLTASGLNQLFSNRRTQDCSGMPCLPLQPFDVNQSQNNLEVFIRLSDGVLWVWNGNSWEGPFTPINDCNTGMLFYAGTLNGIHGMYEIGLGALVQIVTPT